MAKSIFDAPRWKLERARILCDEFRRFSMEFHATRIYQTSTTLENDGWFATRAVNVKPFPVEYSTMLGDIAHNLRSALDSLIYSLAKPSGAKQERLIQFPITDEPSDFHKAIRTGSLTGAADAVILLVESFQPYHGKPLLAMVRDINNWDKHRALTIASSYVTDFKFDPELKGVSTVAAHETFSGQLSEGMLLSRVRLGYGEIGDSIRFPGPAIAALQSVFSLDMPCSFAGLPAQETLARAGNYIAHHMLPLFEPFED